MSKYIDLAAKFSAERDFTSAATVVAAFGSWLDEHPDQAPGRTITQSDFERRTARHSNFYTAGYGDALTHHGITIAPDPEPKTEADKLIDLMVRIDPNGKLDQVEILKAMAEHGVKAPEE